MLRASAAITTDTSFVVIGSQSILLPHPDAPPELLLSNELDLYPAMHPERAELIAGAIGEWSMFHDTFGYHADGVGPETAKMPADWIRALLRHRMIEAPRLEARLRELDASTMPIETYVAWARRRAFEAAA